MKQSYILEPDAFTRPLLLQGKARVFYEPAKRIVQRAASKNIRLLEDRHPEPDSGSFGEMLNQVQHDQPDHFI